MMLYFAYGANMERAAMARRCPTATAAGCGMLTGWRYTIVQGYGSVVPAKGGCVHGVVWRLNPRDLSALNLFEGLDSGLYRRAMLTVRTGGGRARALVYVGRQRGRRRPMPGYQERVIAAALEWSLPPFYIRGLRRFAPAYRAARPAETGEIV